MRKLHGLAAAALAAGLIAAPLLAAPADTVRSRITAYRELGAAFKAVNDGLRGSEVQTIMIQQSARQIRNAARGQYALFPAGSDASTGVKTAAKPEIWTRPAQFRTAQDNFARAADTFFRAASSGDAAAIRAEARKLGGTCKGCHDTFKVPAN